MTTEHSNKITAFSISLFFHLLLVIFLFLFVLKTPIPPFGGGQGVVLNLGYVDEGTGEVQTLNNPNESTVQEENKPLDEPLPDKSNPEKTNSDPASTKDNENLLASDEESEVKTEQKTQHQEDIQPKEALTKTEEEKNKKTVTKVNPNALFGGQTGTSNKGGNNNGDKVDKVGDQGNPQGDINAKALYGKAGTGGDGSGGSGGASLDLAGWRWEQKPRVKDENEDENGKIVFQITIDEQGEIVSIKTLEKTVSPAVEKLYRDEVEKLSFVKTDNKIPALTSTGKITFIIRAR